MKKIIAILLLLTLAVSLVACNNEPVGYKDHFVHQTPEEKQEHTKILLERDDFAQYIEEVVNVQAYPNMLILSGDGTEVVGTYIYDPETGLATGWTDLNTGETILYEAGKEKNLGKPDPQKMVKFAGTVKLGFAVYEKDGKATGAELYFFLSDAQDAQILRSYMTNFMKETPIAESDTVYNIIKDEQNLMADFKREEAAGCSFYNQNADDYASLLRIHYGVKPVIE
jgi:hypothetical protein